MKDLDRDQLYLHCEDCEHGWRDPDKSRGGEGMFLTLDEDFGARPATADEIQSAGWMTFVVGHADAP